MPPYNGGVFEDEFLYDGGWDRTPKKDPEPKPKKEEPKPEPEPVEEKPAPKPKKEKKTVVPMYQGEQDLPQGPTGPPSFRSDTPDDRSEPTVVKKAEEVIVLEQPDQPDSLGAGLHEGPAIEIEDEPPMQALSFTLPGDDEADGDMTVDETPSLEMDEELGDLSQGFPDLENLGHPDHPTLENGLSFEGLDKGFPGLETLGDPGLASIVDPEAASEDPDVVVPPSAPGEGVASRLSYSDWDKAGRPVSEGEPAPSLESLVEAATDESGSFVDLEDLAALTYVEPGEQESFLRRLGDSDEPDKKAITDAIEDELAFDYGGYDEFEWMGGPPERGQLDEIEKDLAFDFASVGEAEYETDPVTEADLERQRKAQADKTRTISGPGYIPVGEPGFQHLRGDIEPDRTPVYSLGFNLGDTTLDFSKMTPEEISAELENIRTSSEAENFKEFEKMWQDPDATKLLKEQVSDTESLITGTGTGELTLEAIEAKKQETLAMLDGLNKGESVSDSAIANLLAGEMPERMPGETEESFRERVEGAEKAALQEVSRTQEKMKAAVAAKEKELTNDLADSLGLSRRSGESDDAFSQRVYLATLPEGQPRASDQGVIGDTVSEMLTFGKAETGTYNQKDLGKKFESHQYTLENLYDKAVVLASENGNQIVQSKDEFVAGMLGDKRDWVKNQIDSHGTAGELATDFALSMVPIVGTVKTWKDTGSIGLTLLSVAGDVLTVVPVLGAGAIAVRAGTSPTRAIGAALKAEAVGTFTAPWQLIKNPNQVVKEVVGKPLEMMFKPGRMPLGAVTTQEGTLRVAIKNAGSPEDALKIRDKVVSGLMEGGRGTATIKSGDTVKTIEVDVAPIIKRTDIKGTHATPDVRFAKSSQSARLNSDAADLEDAALLNQRLGHEMAAIGDSAGAADYFDKATEMTRKAQGFRRQANAIENTPEDFAYEVLPSSEGLGQFLNPGGVATRFTKSAASPGVVVDPDAVHGALLMGGDITDAALIGPESLKAVNWKMGADGSKVYQVRPDKDAFWRSTAEMEATIPVGTLVPKATDEVIVRQRDGTLLVMPVFGTEVPLVTKYGLKFEGLAADVKTIFRGDAVRLSSKEIDNLEGIASSSSKKARQLEETANEMELAGERGQAATLMKEANKAREVANDAKAVLRAENIADLDAGASTTAKLADAKFQESRALRSMANEMDMLGQTADAAKLRSRADDLFADGRAMVDRANEINRATANLKATGAGVGAFDHVLREVSNLLNKSEVPHEDVPLSVRRDAEADLKAASQASSRISTPKTERVIEKKSETPVPTRTEAVMASRSTASPFDEPFIPERIWHVGDEEVLRAEPTRVDEDEVLRAEPTRVDEDEVLRAEPTRVDDEVGVRVDPVRVDDFDQSRLDNMFKGDDRKAAATAKKDDNRAGRQSADDDAQAARALIGDDEFPDRPRGGVATPDEVPRTIPRRVLDEAPDEVPPRTPRDPGRDERTGRGRTPRRTVVPQEPAVTRVPPMIRPTSPKIKLPKGGYDKPIKNMRKGRYPKQVGWRQGKYFGYQDLTNGNTYYSSQPMFNKLPRGRNLKPLDTLQVVQTGNKPPRDRQFTLGNTIVRVGKKSITFRHKKTGRKTL